MIRYAVVAFALLLASCASSQTPDPVGIGRGSNDLKRSPCACTEIPMLIPPGARVG